MSFTPEQTAAREALTYAAQRLVNAFGEEGDPAMLLSHYVLVTSEMDFDADGGQGSMISRFCSDGMTDWQALGLLLAEVEDLRYERHAAG